ncbi:transcriptional regulator ATRX homolog isoform X2 [Chanodichthys erythropterus]
MLLKLLSQKKRDNRPKRSTSKSHAHPDTTSQSVFYQSLESEDKTNEDRNDLDSTVRSEDDEKQPTSSSKTEDGNEMVEERKSPLPIQTQADESSREPKAGELLEDENNKEPSVEEHMAGAASLLNNLSRQSSAHTSHLSMSSDRCDTAQMEFKHEQLDEACGGPSKPVGMDTSSVLTHQTVVNNTSRTARSASDPIAQKPKEERPLSAPSISDLREYEYIANAMKRFSKAAEVLGWEDSDMSFGGMEQENSHAKTQKKGMKNKMKNLTHKLMEKLKEKRDCEQADSKSIQDSGEEEAQSLNSMEMEVEAAKAAKVPPPLPPKKGKYVFLDRKFTLKDFKLDFEPINLMDEIFTGDEWLNYLPSKTSPAEKDTSDQPMTNDVVQTEKDTQLDIPVLTPEQDKSEDIKNNQEDVSDAQQDNVAEVNSDSHVRQVKQDAKTFAIPKALLTNNAKKQMSSGMDCESKKSGDIYDRLDMYIIPKKDLPLMKKKSSDAPPMDFSAVKSFGLLDNSALKSRIRLSKKRPHKPPKKVKTDKSNAKFYKIPGVIPNESPVSAPLPFKSIPFSKSPPLHSPLFPDHT